MSVALRIIPCLDVKDGRVVKGVNFENLRDAGDPVELAEIYGNSGADELTFLDISASKEGRKTTRDMVQRCAEKVSIPLCVGGGISAVEDVELLLQAGADKVSINTGAIVRPQVINEIAARFGSQVLVLSLDARRESGLPSGYGVVTHGGSKSVGLDALEWAKEAADRGVGEILLNSMDRDGTTDGYDLEMTADLREAVDVPIIASGGAGKVEDFVAAAKVGADALLAASVFHFQTVSVKQVKEALKEAGFEVR